MSDASCAGRPLQCGQHRCSSLQATATATASAKLHACLLKWCPAAPFPAPPRPSLAARCMPRCRPTSARSWPTQPLHTSGGRQANAAPLLGLLVCGLLAWPLGLGHLQAIWPALAVPFTTPK